jgi:hypothetical protein
MDTASPGKALESFLTVLCPTVCSVGVGLIVLGVRVLTPQSGFFQLGVNAMIVGVLVLMARRWSPPRFLGAGVLFVAILTAAGARAGPRIMLHTAVLIAMWVGVVFLNVRVFSRCRWKSATGQYLAWSLVFAIGLFGVGVILLVLFRPPETGPSLAFYAKLAALTGIGLGLGFRVQDWLCAGPRGGTA